MFSYFISAFRRLTRSSSDSFFQTLRVPPENDTRPARRRLRLTPSPLDLFPVSEHWDYHPHPHPHPVEFENLPETNFTELQSVQALHPPCHPVRYETENLIDPNLGAHPHVLQQSVSFPCRLVSFFCAKEQFAPQFCFCTSLIDHGCQLRTD